MTITAADYFALHGKPDSEVLLANADEIIRRVNLLLVAAAASDVHPGIDQISKNPVASGYRPAGVNAATSNASVRSTHLTCEAVDLQDQLMNRDLAVWCCKNEQALQDFNLWMEDPRWTGGRAGHDPWVHLQSRPPKSNRRIYVPSLAEPNDPDFYVRNKLKGW